MKTGIVRTLARVAALPLAAVALPAVAHAQRGAQREIFEWSGNVDQEVRIQMRGGQASMMGMGPRDATVYDHMRAVSGIPAAPGYVTVQMLQGRGRADVIQQPSAQNGYTTVVRVRDMQGGAGQYDLAAYWQPTGNYGYNNGGYNTGRYGTYGKQYPNGGRAQPVYRNGYPVNQQGYPVNRQGYPVNQGGKQLPGTQQNGPVYGTYPYPYPSGQRVNPNGKVLPPGAQRAHWHRNDDANDDGNDQGDGHGHGHGNKHRDHEHDDD